MIEVNLTCKFSSSNKGEAPYECEFSRYKSEDHCVFHSSDVEGKADDFRTALTELIALNRAIGVDRSYFRGFIFPSFVFSKVAPDGIETLTVFRDCVFEGNVNFGQSLFGRTSFVRCVFHGVARFNQSKFTGKAIFFDCAFSKRTAFGLVRFFGGITIDSCSFGARTHFYDAEFSGTATITDSEFLGDALFGRSTFLGAANFVSSRFLKRVDFREAIFYDEISLDESHLHFLKNLGASGVSLQGAILESAMLWNVPVLMHYSFRDAFLISLNLANKRVVDCDFTGAVLKAVFVQGWKPDKATINNTKYIYTDYETIEEGGRKFYKIIEESRVPAEGTFGSGEHLRFTIADYLKEPLKWSFALNVPPIFRTAVLNYLQFFTDFMSITESISVEIRTKQEGNKIRVEFMTGTQEEKEVVRERFNQYRENTTKDLASLDIRFRNSGATEIEKELFLIRYEHTINTLRTELNYTRRLLQKEEEKNQLQEKYLALLAQANVFANDPQRLLLPAPDPSSQRSNTPIFFLTADLKDYSKETQANDALYPLIQTFLFDQRELIKQDPVCDAVKLEGDAIKVFFRDGVKLIWIAKRLISDFENLKYERPSGIRGFRVVLGYGTSHREQRGEDVDYSGDPIVETCRVDQPMKHYIEEFNEDPNQIWCTEAFHDEISDRHPNLAFEELPPMDLEKGYASGVRLFRVRVQ
jgi:uncharacterized protein YjbI with pentapeptide repeats